LYVDFLLVVLTLPPAIFRFVQNPVACRLFALSLAVSFLLRATFRLAALMKVADDCSADRMVCVDSIVRCFAILRT